MIFLNWGARTAFAVVSIIASLAPASAQDTSGSALWQGTYVGLNAGYARGSSDASGTVPATSNMNTFGRDAANAVTNGSFSDRTMLRGLTFGAAQRAGQFVLGIEADLSALSFDSKRDTGIVSGSISSRGVDRVSADWLATVRLRLGYAIGASLFYGTAGPAFSNISISRTVDWNADPCPIVELGFQRCHAAKDELQAGWTVGGGIEHALSQNWTVKAEYLYADFGEAEFRSTSVTFSDQVIDHKIDLNMHLGRVGVNYRF